MRPEGVKAKFPAPTHLVQASRHARANQGKTRHEWKEQRQIGANEVYADDRIENAEQNGEERLAQEFEDGQEIVGAFGQRVLEVGWPYPAYDAMGRYRRAGEHIYIFHEALLGDLLR